MILAHRVRKVQFDLISRLPYWNRLSSVRQDVLINMAYNLGVEGLMKFKVTLSMVEAGRYEEASKQMLQSKWAKQVGKRSIELSNMMREG
jgi:lysozyme